MKVLLFSAFFWAAATALVSADPVITFDDLPGTFAPVPPGYHELGWTNVAYADGVNYPFNPSGLLAGVVSSNNVIYNVGATASIGGEMFDFLSAYVTSAFNDNEQFETKGYIRGTLVYDQTNTLSATSSTLIQFNFYGVDHVELTPSGGTPHSGYSGSGAYFVIDNLSVVTYVPYATMPLFTNGGFETGDFSGWFHGGNTNDTYVTNSPLYYVHSGTYGAQLGSTTLGTLSQTIRPTDIGRSYTVSFWLENSNGSLNSFSMSWGGLPVFGLTNQPPFDWTNFQFNVTASQPSEFLQFQFFNIPSYFGFDDFSIAPTRLVSNGGFEAGDFSGWTQSGPTGNDSVINNLGIPRVGSYVARFGAVSNLSFISQDISTVTGQSYLLSLWLDNPDGSFPNQYHAYWDGMSLDNQTNITSTVWTNLHYAVIASNAPSNIRFGFRDDPQYLLMDDVSVVPTPLVKNGGFEFGDFTGWNAGGNFTFCSVGFNTNASSGYYNGFFGPEQTLAFLSQNVPTVPGQSYVVGFTLNNPSPMTNTEFRVSWNGIVLLDFTNLGLTGWLQYEYVVPASDSTTTLEFGFRDDPGYLGLDDVFVSPIPAPVFQSVNRDTNSNLLNLSWSAIPGYLYEVQYATNLSAPNWKVLNSGFSSPTNLPMSTIDTNPPDKQRFYRVLMHPPFLIE